MIKKLTPKEFMDIKEKDFHEIFNSGFDDTCLDKSDIEFNYLVRECAQLYRKYATKIEELEDYFIQNYPPKEKF